MQDGNIKDVFDTPPDLEEVKKATRELEDTPPAMNVHSSMYEAGVYGTTQKRTHYLCWLASRTQFLDLPNVQVQLSHIPTEFLKLTRNTSRKNVSRLRGSPSKGLRRRNHSKGRIVSNSKGLGRCSRSPSKGRIVSNSKGLRRRSLTAIARGAI